MMKTSPTLSESAVNPISSRSGSAVDISEPLTALEQIEKFKEDAEVLAWGMRQYQRCRSQRVLVEREWYINLAFYFGKQNVQLTTSNASTNGFQLIVPKAPPWRVRLVINRCRPTIRKQVANLTSQEPRFYTVPAGTEDDDVTSARIAEALLDSYYREAHYKSKLKRLVWWGSICGTAFFKTYWDKTIKDSNGNLGSIVTDVIDPFHIYAPDLLQWDIELQPFIIHASTMSPDKVKSIYGVEVSSTISATNQILEDQFLNLTGVTKTQSLNEVLVLEIWVKPGAFNRFPEGAVLTIAGEQLVQNKRGWPYTHGEYPFSKFDDVDSGKFYGVSVLTDLLPLQRELNRTRSQIVEGKNLMAKPKLLAARGSINPNAITSEPGQVVLFTPGFNPPVPLQNPQLPAYVETEVQRLQLDIEDLAGQHDISRLISSRTSATALSYVQNADATMVAGAATSIEQLTEKTGRQVISLVKKFWTTTRTIKVVGYDEAFETLSFINTDIKDNTEIYVETGSALPQDRAGRQAFLMDAFKLGLINDPNDVLELMDIGGMQKIKQDLLVDQRAAQRENMQMVALGKNPPEATFSLPEPIDPLQDLIDRVSAGEVIEDSPPVGNTFGLPTQESEQEPEIPQFVINDWDNHQVHILIHNRYRKSERFESLPDITKKIFQQHVSLHTAALQQGIQGQPIPVPGSVPNPSEQMGGQPQIGMTQSPQGAKNPADPFAQ